MEKPRLEEVFRAIEALYSGQNSEGSKAASKWLGNLQNSVCFVMVIFFCLYEHNFTSNGTILKFQVKAILRGI